MSSYRTIPIPNFLLEYYKDLYDNCSSYYNFNDNWYVFGNIDPLPETTLRGRKTKNAFKDGVKDIRVHDFRHSCTSLLIDSGANITLVAKYLGHSKIDETLNTYSHMYQNRLENIVQIIEVQNTKLLESKQKKLPEPKKTIIDYDEDDYYDYEKDLDNKKEELLKYGDLSLFKQECTALTIVEQSVETFSFIRMLIKKLKKLFKLNRGTINDYDN